MTELAREYGDGLYALCAQENLSEQVLEELTVLKACFRQQRDFFRLLSNMSLSKPERIGILDRALRSQVHPYVLNFLKILCERGALGEFEGCEAAYREDFNRDNNVAQATVTTSRPLTDAQRQELTKKLCAMSSKQVELTEKVDESVIDGVLVEMNGQRYDNTVRQRLQAIRQAMVQEN